MHGLPSPAQPSPAQPSPAQPSPAQPSPAQPSPAQLSSAQLSSAQLSSAQHAEPRFYGDWQRRDSDNQSAKFCGTPPLAHIAGLETAIALLEEEALPNVWARHQRPAGAVHAAAAVAYLAAQT
jgi:aspartate aminotransferase-like enzyme